MSDDVEAAPAAVETQTQENVSETQTQENAPETQTKENGAQKSQDKDEKSEPRRDERHSYSSHKNTHVERRNKYMNSSKNVRTDYASLPETDDPDEIRKQVEFYFSDSNLYYDDHMRQRVLGNKEDQYGENHGVPIKEIHSFKRMKRFQPYSAVVAALKESKMLDVTGDKDECVQRKTPLPKPADDDGDFGGDPTIPRAIYAKGFGEEGKTTQFDIEAFFTPYGPLNSVRLRRSFPDRIFKGSVFVEFESEELQQQFLAMDPKPKYEGSELLIKSKREYCDEKLVDVKSGKIQSNRRNMNFKNYYQGDRNGANNHNNNSRSNRGGRDGKFRGGGRGGRGGGGGRHRDGRDGGGKRDRDDWRGRRDDFQAQRKEQEEGDEAQEKQQNGEPEKAAIATTDADADAIANAAASKKRTREDEGGDDVDAKKVKADDAVAEAS